MKSSDLEDFNSKYMPNPIFRITRFDRSSLKPVCGAKPFLIKPGSFKNQNNVRKKEEEKLKPQYVHKIGNVEKLVKPTFNFSKTENELHYMDTTKSAQMVKSLEKEVKLSNMESLADEKFDKQYSDERLAIEDTYGLVEDDMFDINQNNEFETLSETARDYQGLNQSHPMNQDDMPVATNESGDHCDGLKKGIDNDAVIADISTMDGLSVYGDLLNSNSKKYWMFDQIDGINVLIDDSLNHPLDGNKSSNKHRNHTIGRNYEDNIEEEKVQHSPTKYENDDFPMMIDFEINQRLMDTSMADDIQLVKHNSYKQARCMSLFEEESRMFAQDFGQDHTLRDKSFSDISEKEWYDRDWKNPTTFENEFTKNVSLKQIKAEEEDEYFKKFDDVLVQPDLKSEGFTNLNFTENNTGDYPKSSKILTNSTASRPTFKNQKEPKLDQVEERINEFFSDFDFPINLSNTF